MSAATLSDAPSRAEEITAPWGVIPRGVVDGGEIILLAIKPSMWRPLFDSAAWLVTAALLATAVTCLQTPMPGLSLILTVQLILAVAVARFGLAVIRWIPTWFILTNRRIITIQGVRAPRISACRLVDVRNTYLQRGPVERRLSLGSITFVTDQSDPSPLTWVSISQPDEVHARIRRAIEHALDAYGV